MLCGEAGGQITYTELSAVSLEAGSEDPERIYSPDNEYESGSQVKIGHTRKSAPELLPQPCC